VSNAELRGEKQTGNDLLCSRLVSSPRDQNLVAPDRESQLCNSFMSSGGFSFLLARKIKRNREMSKPPHSALRVSQRGDASGAFPIGSTMRRLPRFPSPVSEVQYRFLDEISITGVANLLTNTKIVLDDCCVELLNGICDNGAM
jgi:hypothetical protein